MIEILMNRAVGEIVRQLVAPEASQEEFCAQ